jgi:hypothetical protein
MNMRPNSLLRCCTVVCAVVALLVLVSSPRAADTIPAQYSDHDFWKMVTDYSEPNGVFQYENFVSNEVSYQDVVPELKRVTKPGGIYIGVAAEQNFTYIAALQPKIAFILDIRRQNMIELLMYKALFELSDNRAEFAARLFSRKRPAGLTAASSAEEMFRAFDSVPADPQLYAETLKAIKESVIRKHEFTLVGDDEQKIEYVFNAFFRGGPRMDYGFASSTPNPDVPSYYNLMVATDGHGQDWAFLENEDRYKFVRNMQQKNLIVPLVGDFSGPKTIKAIGQYAKDHAALLSVFYISNVEDYLSASWPAYLSNLRSLPANESTLLLRFIPHANTVLSRIQDIPERWPGQYWH